jgi:hypothetical protein
MVKLLKIGCHSCPSYLSRECLDNDYCKGGINTYGCDECSKVLKGNIDKFTLLFPRKDAEPNDLCVDDYRGFCSKKCRNKFISKHKPLIIIRMETLKKKFKNSYDEVFKSFDEKFINKTKKVK